MLRVVVHFEMDDLVTPLIEEVKYAARVERDREMLHVEPEQARERRGRAAR